MTYKDAHQDTNNSYSKM